MWTPTSLVARLCGAATGCAVVVRTASALADPACYGPLSPCINDDVFWPHAGPARFVQVGSTETVQSGQLGFGLVATYLSRPIVLQVPAPGGSGSMQYAVDQQANGSFVWAYGVSDRLELDLVLPLTFIQSGAGLAPVTGGAGLKDTAVRDMRFGFTYGLIPHVSRRPDTRASSFGEWGLAFRLETSAPTGDPEQFAGEANGVLVPSLAADFRHPGGLVVGMEAGARLRPTTDLLDARVGSELVLAGGAGYEILPQERLTATLEAWALPMLVAQGDGTHPVPAEWQLAVRTRPVARQDVSIQLGGGGPLETNAPITTPQFRFTLGVRWAPSTSEPPRAP